MQQTPNPRGRPAVGKIELAVFAIFVIAGAAFWFFSRDRAPRLNIILISSDTTRADHVSAYGYRGATGAATTPNIDELASRGALFAEAHSTTSWTLPAHMALLTGMPNQLHGVRYDKIRLDEHRKTLAERLTGAGYQSVGFFGGPYLHPIFGFARGFARYEPFTGARMAYDTLQGQSDINVIRVAERESHRIPTAEKLTNQAIDFLTNGRDPDRPFFLFLHHWDAHYDYVAPERLVRKFAPDHDEMKERLPMSNFISNPRIHKDMPPEEYRYVLANYDAEIAHVDEQIGRLFQKLRELDLLENTLIVFTSDHGEEFFEHGNKGHRYNLHRESLHVPLVIAGPGVRKNVAIEETVRIFDIAPTILDLAGLDATDEEIYGQSLAPFLRGDSIPGPLRDLPILAELTFMPAPEASATETAVPVDPSYFFHHEAFSKLDHKVIEVRKREFDAAKPMLLDTPSLAFYPPRVYSMRDPNDPYEGRDRSLDDPEFTRKLRTELARTRQGLAEYRKGLKSITNPTPVPTNDAIREQLRQNGYLDAGPPPVLDEPIPDEDLLGPEGADPESKPSGSKPPDSGSGKR